MTKKEIYGRLCHRGGDFDKSSVELCESFHKLDKLSKLDILQDWQHSLEKQYNAILLFENYPRKNQITARLSELNEDQIRQIEDWLNSKDI